MNNTNPPPYWGGGLFFNLLYLSYQQDYYRQKGFEYQLSISPELNDCKNIVYINLDSGRINTQEYYQLNAIAELAYGVQDKYIMSDKTQISRLTENDLLKSRVDSGRYHMSSYDLSHKEIDAIVVYSMDIGLFDTIKMKIYEIVGSHRFEDWIKNRTSMVIYYNGTNDFDELLSSI